MQTYKQSKKHAVNQIEITTHQKQKRKRKKERKKSSILSATYSAELPVSQSAQLPEKTKKKQ